VSNHNQTCSTYFQVYRGDTLDALVPVNGPFDFGSDGCAPYAFAVSKGVTYQFAIGAFSEGEREDADLSLQLFPFAPNDDFRRTLGLVELDAAGVRPRLHQHR
jgi:hypothetical protein